MKKIKYAFALLTAPVWMVYTACSSDAGAKEFAAKVADYVTANNVEALAKIYPDVSFDSVGFATAPGEMVVNMSGDTATVDFGNGANMKLVADADSFKIVGSTGLVAYPADQVEFARACGMFEGVDLNDSNLTKLMGDTAFFSWVNKVAASNLDNILTLKKGKEKYVSLGEGIGRITLPVTITNNTSEKFNSQDYVVKYTVRYSGCSDGSEPDSYKTKVSKGQDVEPGKSVTVVLKETSGGISNPRVEITAPREELAKKFCKPTGKEYQEYISGK